MADARAPQSRKIGAAAKALAQIMRQRADVGPAGDGRKEARGGWCEVENVEALDCHIARLHRGRLALSRQFVGLASADLDCRVRRGDLLDRAEELMRRLGDP